MTRSLDAVDVLNLHYDRALKAIDEARADHDRAVADVAHPTADPAQHRIKRNEAEGRARVVSHREGAADALEQLADALGVQLTNDRRREAQD